MSFPCSGIPYVLTMTNTVQMWVKQCKRCALAKHVFRAPMICINVRAGLHPFRKIHRWIWKCPGFNWYVYQIYDWSAYEEADALIWLRFVTTAVHPIAVSRLVLYQSCMKEPHHPLTMATANGSAEPYVRCVFIATWEEEGLGVWWPTIAGYPPFYLGVKVSWNGPEQCSTSFLLRSRDALQMSAETRKIECLPVSTADLHLLTNVCRPQANSPSPPS